jgi:PQQ-dependent catabolism-associated CXXCW motif protein
MKAITSSKRHSPRNSRTVRGRLAIVGVLAASILAGAAARSEEVPEPDHYRTDHYRAPVPQTLNGARVITTAEAAALWKRGDAAFVDVLPRPPKPKLPPGTLWRDEPRLDIPGSIWLPDTGYGALAAPMQAYLRNGLVKATGGNRAKPLVIYCLEDCWMSWNAARRAVVMGYSHVIWYPAGTDGWSDAGLPLKEATPEPRPAQ